MKEKLVIIGANDFQNQIILKAKEMNYETHVFAWKENAIGKENSDYFYPIDIKNKEEILMECKKIKPIGVCSIASDLAVNTVDYISRNLGLTANSEISNLYCTNKYEMRKQLKKCNIKVPHFEKVDSIDKLNYNEFKFPLIIKPTDRSGSRGVTKVYKKDECDNAIRRAISESFEKMAIVEEYIDGEEYSCECISYKCQHYFLAFTKKYTTGKPYFIETGHSQPSDIKKEFYLKIQKEIFKALDALKIENGASHTEFKLDKQGNIRIIEIGARGGGDCISSDLVKLSTGYDFLKMIIDVSCGKKPNFIKCNDLQKVYIKFIFSQQDLEELENIKNDMHYKIYRISNMNLENIGKIKDSSSRVGYYIYTIND